MWLRCHEASNHTNTAHLRWIGSFGGVGGGGGENPHKGIKWCGIIASHCTNRQVIMRKTKMGGSHILASGGVTQIGFHNVNIICTYALHHSFQYSCHHSCHHSFIIHSTVRSSFISSLISAFIHAVIHCIMNVFIRLIMHFIHSFIYAFINSFIHSCIQ